MFGMNCHGVQQPQFEYLSQIFNIDCIVDHLEITMATCVRRGNVILEYSMVSLYVTIHIPRLPNVICTGKEWASKEGWTWKCAKADKEFS